MEIHKEIWFLVLEAFGKIQMLFLMQENDNSVIKGFGKFG